VSNFLKKQINFKIYDLDHIEDAVRDAINNALEESGYNKKLLFLKTNERFK